MKFNSLQFIKNFSAIYHRQGKQETKAARYLINLLRQHDVHFHVEPFITYIPKFISAILTADGKKIPATANSLVSGKITGKYNMASSLIPSRRFTKEANLITFNPYCHARSQANYYYVPSVTVEPKYLKYIFAGKNIKGEVKVKTLRYISKNILVGNTVDPKTIIFAHYDSIGPGALDDASGIALLLKMITAYPETTADTLYIFAGNEELSYDRPIYWGHGYRAFEKKHKDILEKCEQIICVDCVGASKPMLYRDKKTVKQGLPLANLDRWLPKTSMLACEYDTVMKIYHSDLDTWRKVKPKYLNECLGFLKKLIKTT